MLSGAADGELIYWSIPERKALFQINAHDHFVRGCAFAGNHTLSADQIFVSTGDDKKVCIWSLNAIKQQYKNERLEGNASSASDRIIFKNYKPKASYLSKTSLLNVDHSYTDDLFATSGAVVQIWSYERSTPIQNF
jgi:DDB1- and CUL4-associated factor 13